MHVAALCGTKDSVRFFIKYSTANVNSVNKLVQSYLFKKIKLNFFSAGETPLHYAIRAGKKDVVKLLLNMGADIHVTGNQGNAMQVAVKENRHEILDLLNSGIHLFGIFANM